MKAKVLLVDDEPAVLKCLTSVLSRLGHEVTTAQSGEEALDHLDHQPYNLVITDFRMPGISGAEVIEAVRERQDDAAIILITGLVDELPARLRAGPESVRIVAKPFALGQFCHAVDQALHTAVALAH